MDYGIMLCEDLMEAGWRAAGVGAGIGAGVGAAGSSAMWAKKRLGLNKKLKACGDDACRQTVKSEIKNLRSKALKYGAAATVAGAGLGAAAGKSKEILAKKGVDASVKLQQTIGRAPQDIAQNTGRNASEVLTKTQKQARLALNLKKAGVEGQKLKQASSGGASLRRVLGFGN